MKSSYGRAIWIVAGIACVGFASFALIPISPCMSQEDVARAHVTMIFRDVLDAFKRDVGRYPSTAEGLSVLVHAPTMDTEKWGGAYLTSDLALRDPWGQVFGYQSPGSENPESYDVWSLGRDGVKSRDDIGNWGKNRRTRRPTERD